jgi:hypothetical protein
MDVDVAVAEGEASSGYRFCNTLSCQLPKEESHQLPSLQ